MNFKRNMISVKQNRNRDIVYSIVEFQPPTNFIFRHSSKQVKLDNYSDIKILAKFVIRALTNSHPYTIN